MLVVALVSVCIGSLGAGGGWHPRKETTSFPVWSANLLVAFAKKLAFVISRAAFVDADPTGAWAVSMNYVAGTSFLCHRPHFAQLFGQSVLPAWQSCSVLLEFAAGCGHVPGAHNPDSD